MTEDEFWEVIKRTRSEHQDVQVAKLTAELENLEPSEILAFEDMYGTLLDRADRVKLWGAAMLINDWGSDDGFEYFRSWLMAQGREIYDAAVADPDSLADARLTENCTFEMFRDPSETVYRAKTGVSLHEAVRDREAPVDDELDEDEVEIDENHLEKQYPRLAAAMRPIREAERLERIANRNSLQKLVAKGMALFGKSPEYW